MVLAAIFRKKRTAPIPTPDLPAEPSPSLLFFSLAFVLLLTLLPALVMLLRVAYRRWQLSHLPRLPGAKLTKASLNAAARDYSPVVRLPGQHGVLVTDPQLARKLLDVGAAGGVCRDIEAYQKYGGFLSGSLVLLEQSSPQHRALRTALLPLFSASATRRSHDVLLSCTCKLIQNIGDHSKKLMSHNGAASPLYRLLQQYVVDVTARCFFAAPISDADTRRLIAILEEWLATAQPPPPPPSAWRRLQLRLEDRLGRKIRWSRSPAKHISRGTQSPEETAAAEEEEAEAAEEADSLRRMYDAILNKICTCQAEFAAAATLPPDFASAPVIPSVHTALGPLATPSEVRAQTAGLLFAGLNSAKELNSILTLLAANPGLQADA